ncbi:gentisate 1,2-dioxygenase [Allopusillimonas soli]|uniref:Gentisate 1,2-dioxygenase n=1 Tax=Allopusillimonas soli TaxID=659016 RepID=A0A853F5X0_9BURK|nr:gentisate 1,2-dioxygenase [Allopusillimonas soli]NYT35935.1 gentisate 1,2-dioxygenase [Allopusillimonas soli]TEA76289.1 gentisate 1,2-dioxygenase [Allopusillimonas soli]
MTTQARNKAEREAYYARIDKKGMTPLWESLHALVPTQPTTDCRPALWKYAAIRGDIMDSGSLITAEEAVRRVLVLENPGLRGLSSITPTLYAGLQLILPGEIAPSHRHVQSALRFIVEGTGAYTSVDGERTIMHPGDFIITPSWTWHDHGNLAEADGGEPVVWLDGLDIPFIRTLGTGFAEPYPEAEQPLTRADGDSLARYGYNMLPVSYEHTSKTSPLINYPYDRTREALDHLQHHGEIDAWDGVKLRYVNPATGGYAMPTMATFMQYLPKDFRGKAQRSTDATVYCAVEGRGHAVIGDARYDFEPHDVFVVPSWQPVQLNADEETVLFSFSDRPIQQALGLLRTQRID